MAAAFSCLKEGTRRSAYPITRTPFFISWNYWVAACITEFLRQITVLSGECADVLQYSAPREQLPGNHVPQEQDAPGVSFQTFHDPA
jgi:hypothetical protein